MLSADKNIDIVTLPGITENYQLLRERAMDYIRQTTSANWTDHNIHDPGITIVEALCYALSDVGYRMNFPASDLMLTDQGASAPNIFYQPEEILPSRPITIKDYRKILLDIPGVRNAWILPVSNSNTSVQLDYEPVYLFKEESRLIHAYEVALLSISPQKKAEILAHPVFINGLYAISLELDSDPVYGNLNSGEAYEAVFTNDFTGSVYYDIPKWHSIVNNHALFNELKSVYPTHKNQLSVSLLPSAKNKYNNSDGKLLTRKMTQWYWTVQIKHGAADLLTLPDVYFEMFGTPQQPVVGQVVSDILTSASLGFFNAMFERIIRAGEAFAGIAQVLRSNRNLCEDFLPQCSAIPETEVRFCADIDVKPLFDIEQVQAEIFKRIEDVITPPIGFFSFQEMKEQGLGIEEVLEGPRLRHGFLPDDAMGSDSWTDTDLFLSDIINAIYEIDGLVNCRNAQLYLVDTNGKKINNDNPWIIKVPDGFKPKLNKRKSKITFYKNELPLTPHFLESMQKLQIIQSAYSRWSSNAVPHPQWNATYRNLAQHFTIADDFPATYKIGRNFPKEYEHDTSWTSSKQLEGYLLLFDQLIANFLTDLDQLKYSLSWNEIKHINFQTVKPDWRKDFHTVQNADSDKQWQQAIESEETFLEKRNNVLDFLLSRFAENLQEIDYNLFSTIDNTHSSTKQFFNKLNTIKQEYLANYISLSMHRSAGVEAFLHATWESTPLSGLELRLSKLLGCDLLKDNKRKKATDISNEDTDSGYFILLEHILLRNPKLSASVQATLSTTPTLLKQMSVCADDDCTGCAGADPFSFTATLVLPAWLKIYSDMQYRDFVERTIRKEAPVGVLLRICWLKKSDMQLFENAIEKWWQTKYNWYSNAILNNEASLLAVLNSTSELIDVMRKQRSIYLPATLHGCEDEELENNTRVFLNKTTISEL